MTDRSKFEQMLEHLINEDQDKAKELFHQLVVEKSREIYEGILAEEFGMYEADDEDEMSDDFGDEGDIGGDETDDFIDDVEGDAEGFGDEGDESEDLEDRIVDLEDALDELRAEFEELMDQEEGEEEHAGEFGFGDEGEEGEEEGGDDFEFGSEDEEDEELKDSFMREYVEQVGGKTYDAYAKGGDKGHNNKSVLAKSAQSPTGHGKPVNFSGESKSGGTQGGLAKPSAKEENFGNVNVPGGNAGKTGFKKKESGHGAEKKSSGDSAENKKSIIGGKK